VRITSVPLSRASGRDRWLRRIYGCAPCRVNKPQCDWAHFGSITIGKAIRPLMAFVMVLSYSRHLFLRFYLNGAMNNFLRGHVEAFNAWGAVPRVVLYDNLKSAVLERHAEAIRFHPTLLELAAHYRFQPRPVAVARGNEKGRVERAIRFVRDRFFCRPGVQGYRSSERAGNHVVPGGSELARLSARS
jgi:transposase